MQYTDKTAVEKYLLTTINSSFDASLTQYIEAMSLLIDNIAGYPIYHDTPATRMYDGNGSTHLVISPVHTITEVTVDGATVTPIQAPYNQDAKYELILKTGFPVDFANVHVTGIHSRHITLPDPIKWACTVLVSAIVNQANNQTDGVASEKIGEYQVSFKSEKDRADFARAKEIINSYRTIRF